MGRSISSHVYTIHRLAREVELYQKEHAEQKAIVSKLSATEGSDEWEIKNAVRETTHRAREGRLRFLLHFILAISH